MDMRKFPGLSPAGAGARTLAVDASPTGLFGFASPFGNRSPMWRPGRELPPVLVCESKEVCLEGILDKF